MAARSRRRAGMRHASGRALVEQHTDERGAVLVETVFMLPILLLLVMGVIEFTLAFQASAKMADASRSGARTVALLGGEDDYAEAASDAAMVALSTLPHTATPHHLVIFEPNAHGWFGTLTSAPSSVAEISTNCSMTPCMSLVWHADLGQFVADIDNWDPEDHDLCGPEYGTVSVMVTASYEPLTDMFATVLAKDARPTASPYRPILERATFRFDPNIAVTC